MPTTSNFGWTTPADTDLVKDGAAAIRTLGNGIDTSLVDLKGGTTGQVLAKASNTDLDFTWSSVDPLTILDAKGDLITATAADTPARLASSGVNGNVLTVDTSTATGLKWAAPAGGGKVLQVVYGTYSTLTTVASTTYTDTGLSVSITPTSATSTILIFVNQSAKAFRSDESQIGAGVKLLRGSTDIYTPDNGTGRHLLQLGVGNSGSTQSTLGAIYSMIYRDSPATTSSTTYKTQGRVWDSGAGGTAYFQDGSTTSSMLLMEIGA